jgi:hypothetical protein
MASERVTRRAFIATAILAARSEQPVIVPVRRIVDAHAKIAPVDLARFWRKIWPQASRDFGSCGVRLQVTDAPGEIKNTAADRPVFVGLDRGSLNLVLTDHLPLYWDASRALAGVTTIYEGYHLCLIALRYAHGHQVPWFSTNTCTHELLHALMQDVYVMHPKWYQSAGREARIDAYATGLWLFHSGDAVRKSAREYVARLRAAQAAG